MADSPEIVKNDDTAKSCSDFASLRLMLFRFKFVNIAGEFQLSGGSFQQYTVNRKIINTYATIERQETQTRI